MINIQNGITDNPVIMNNADNISVHTTVVKSELETKLIVINIKHEDFNIEIKTYYHNKNQIHNYDLSVAYPSSVKIIYKNNYFFSFSYRIINGFCYALELYNFDKNHSGEYLLRKQDNYLNLLKDLVSKIVSILSYLSNENKIYLYKRTCILIFDKQYGNIQDLLNPNEVCYLGNNSNSDNNVYLKRIDLLFENYYLTDEEKEKLKTI